MVGGLEMKGGPSTLLFNLVPISHPQLSSSHHIASKLDNIGDDGHPLDGCVCALDGIPLAVTEEQKEMERRTLRL